MIQWLFIKIAEIVVPVEKGLALFKKPDCLIEYTHVTRALELLEEGDLVFERCDMMLSNLFIPGPYKHVGVYLDGWVYEAVTSGVRKVPIEEWMYKKDHVGIGRQPYFQQTWESLSTGKMFMEKQIAKRAAYQFDFLIPKSIKHPFSKRWRAWFCSEFAYGFMVACCPEFDTLLPIPVRFGENLMTPNDFWMKIEHVATFN